MVDKKSVRELFKALEEQFNFDLVALDKYKEVTSQKKKTIRTCLIHVL